MNIITYNHFKLKVKKQQIELMVCYLVIFNIFSQNAEFIKNVHLRGKFLSYTDAKFVTGNIGKSIRG